MSKRQALGKGLSALLQDARTDITTRKAGTDAPTLHSVSMIPVESIEPNPYQPRDTFSELEMEELAESIRTHGLIQPITVRKMGYDHYQLISGERRWRASRMAGIKEIPAYIRVANDQEMLEMALVENIQREDLDPIEIALSLQRLMEECNLTQEQLSQRIHKQRSSVTNFLRLLRLPAPIQKALREEQITMGHAKILLGIEDEDKQLALFALTLEQELSVRQLEDLVRQNKNLHGPKIRRSKKNLSIEHKLIQEKIRQHFGGNSEFKALGKDNFKIIFRFSGEKDLKKFLNQLGIEA